MPIELDLHYIDELLTVRRQQHGGLRGAPRVVDGYREGESLNRSCFVMVSALLQGYVEDVFIDVSRNVLPNLADDLAIASYRRTFARWGNPSTENIGRLFGRIGVADVLAGLSWRNCSNRTVRSRLDSLNQIRNAIAHGRQEVRVDGEPIALSLARAAGYRDFIGAFAERFEVHATRQLR